MLTCLPIKTQKKHLDAYYIIARAPRSRRLDFDERKIIVFLFAMQLFTLLMPLRFAFGSPKSQPATLGPECNFLKPPLPTQDLECRSK